MTERAGGVDGGAGFLVLTFAAEAAIRTLTRKSGQQ